MIHKVEAFMSEVRDLALPRLKVEEERLRGWEVPMRFTFRTAKNRLNNIIQYGEMGMEMGNTEMDGPSEQHGKAVCLTIHRDDVAAVKGAYGEVIAFTLIHELAHVVTGTGHTKEWAEACQTMGIYEHPYVGQTKREPIVTYPFKDHDFLRQLKRLGTYPGDTVSKEEEAVIVAQLDKVEKEMDGLMIAIAMRRYRL